jgi:hypothetical protein
VQGEINDRYKQAGLRKKRMSSEYQQGLPARAKIARRLREIPTSAHLPVSRVSHLPLPESRPERSLFAFRDRRRYRWRDIPIPGRSVADPNSEARRNRTDRGGNHRVGSKPEMYRV